MIYLKNNITGCSIFVRPVINFAFSVYCSINVLYVYFIYPDPYSKSEEQLHFRQFGEEYRPIA